MEKIMKYSFLKLSLLFMPFSLMGMESQNAESSKKSTPDSCVLLLADYEKADLNEIKTAFQRIATLHKPLLDQFREINEIIAQLEIENSNNSSPMHKLKLYNYNANRSEISAKMMLIDSMIDKIFNKESNLLEMLKEAKEGSIGELIKYLITQTELVSSLEDFPVNDSNSWKQAVEELNKKARKASKSATAFVRECERQKNDINLLNIAQKYNFDANEQLLFVENKIDAEFFGQVLKTDCPNIKNIFAIKDTKNNMTVCIHQYKNAAAKNNWYASCTKKISDWFIAPEINLINGGYRDVDGSKYKLAAHAVAFHTLPKEVDEFAQKYGFYIVSDDETKVIIPTHIIKNGQTFYGNCEFIWNNKTKQCFHRFFKPVKKLSNANIPTLDTNDTQNSCIKENDNDNVTTLIKLYKKLLVQGKAKVLEPHVERLRRDYDKQVKIAKSSTKEERRQARLNLHLSGGQAKDLFASAVKRKHEKSKVKAENKDQQMKLQLKRISDATKKKSAASLKVD